MSAIETTDYADLEKRLLEICAEIDDRISDDGHVGMATGADWIASVKEAASAISALVRERDEFSAEADDMKTWVIAFGSAWAPQYARSIGLDGWELHPAHYDILEQCGGRMDDFRRAVLSSPGDAEDSA